MDKKKTEGEILISESQSFLDYFRDNIDWLTKQQDELTELSQSLTNKIKFMQEHPGTGHGSNMLMGTFYENLINLKTLQQQCNTQLFNIKKAILDYTNKTKSKDVENEDAAEAAKILRSLVKDVEMSRVNDKKTQQKMSDEDLDAAIDKQLEAQQ